MLDQNTAYIQTLIDRRNVGTYTVLLFSTFGLFWVYWIYLIDNELNKLNGIEWERKHWLYALTNPVGWGFLLVHIATGWQLLTGMDKYKTLLDGLIAIHESEHLYKGRYDDRGVNENDIKTPAAKHPLIRTHPITGKKAIYVNRTFTTGIEGMSKYESSSILEFLFNHCEHVNFQIRYRWNKNDMAFWDNRCTMHRAIWDYWPNERKGRRVTIKGDKPI